MVWLNKIILTTNKRIRKSFLTEMIALNLVLCFHFVCPTGTKPMMHAVSEEKEYLEDQRCIFPRVYECGTCKAKSVAPCCSLTPTMTYARQKKPTKRSLGPRTLKCWRQMSFDLSHRKSDNHHSSKWAWDKENCKGSHWTLHLKTV